MIKYGQNCLKLLVRCVFLFILFFMVEVPEKLASNTEVVLAKRRKIDRYIHYSMFQSNIISAWITYAWENQVTECESLHYHYYYYYYIKTSRQRFATHIFLCVCVSAVAEKWCCGFDIFLLNNHSKWMRIQPKSTLKIFRP